MFSISQSHDEKVPTSTIIKNDSYDAPLMNHFRGKGAQFVPQQNHPYMNGQLNPSLNQTQIPNQEYNQFYSREQVPNGNNAPIYPTIYAPPYSPRLGSYNTPLVTPNQPNFPTDPFRETTAVRKDNNEQVYGKRLRMASMDFHNQKPMWEQPQFRTHEAPTDSLHNDGRAISNNYEEPIPRPNNQQKQSEMNWESDNSVNPNVNINPIKFNQYPEMKWENPESYNQDLSKFNQFVQNPMAQFYNGSIPDKSSNFNQYEVQPQNRNGEYFFDNMDFQMINQQQQQQPNNSYQNMMYDRNLPQFDTNLMKTIVMPNTNLHNAQLPPLGDNRKRMSNDLSTVLPMVITGPRPYSPSSNPVNGGAMHKLPFITTLNESHGKPSPLCSTQPIRVPSHLLLTAEQRKGMEATSVTKRTFDLDDPETSKHFLTYHGLLLEQLGKPLSKWKTRNTRKRKNAVTHLYQCCCGSDVKQFHGTKGTRKSKQKFPFVGCLAFVEVARRVSDNGLIWVRGLLDHSQDCINAKPFSNVTTTNNSSAIH